MNESYNGIIQAKRKLGRKYIVSVKQSNRNASLELMRFIAAVTVMTYHFFSICIPMGGIVEFGVVMVEFFFLLSGFFMMQYIEKCNEPMDLGHYLLKKIKGFYAPFIMVFAVQFIIFVLSTPITSSLEIVRALFHFKWEALLLQTAGFIQNPQFNIDYLLGQAWYLSAMMLAVLILYPIAKRFKKNFVSIVCPILVVVSYAYMIQTEGTINVGSEYFGFLSAAIVRGVAGTCLGCVTYEVFDYYKSDDTRINMQLAKTIEIITYISIVALFVMGHIESEFISDQDALVFVLVLAVFIILAMLDKTPISHYINTHGSNVICKLGTLSLYLYLVHWSVMTALLYCANGWNEILTTVLYYIICFTSAILLMLFDNRRKGIRGVLIFVVVLLGIAFSLPFWAM